MGRLIYVEGPEEFTGPGLCLFPAGGISDCPDWQKTATAAFPESPTNHQPITLYELGMLAGAGGTLVVGIDPGYVRRTNVVTQLAPARPELQVHSTLADTLEASRTAIRATR